MGLISTIELERPSIAHREAVSRSPDFADKLVVLSTWMVVLGAVRLVCALVNYGIAALETWPFEPTSIGGWQRLFEANPPIYLLGAAWPLVLGLAMRRTRWPELLKAAALTFLVLSIGGVLATIADWSDPRARWINVGSFGIARASLHRLGLPAILIGLLGTGQLLLEFVTAGRALFMAFRTPDPGLVDSDRRTLALRARFGWLGICLTIGFLIVMVRLPGLTACIEILNQSQWIREFLLRDDFSRIHSTRPSRPPDPDAVRIHQLESLFFQASHAWTTEQYSQSWEDYRHLITLADAIPQSSLAPGGRHSVALAFNGWAWLLATCPEVDLRNPQDAVAYAKRAVNLSPKDHEIWNTLGVANYRVGNWEESQSALYRSMELNDEGTAFDWFFLAMIHAKFGHKDRAREWYDKAVQWSHEKWPGNAELYHFQVEAAEVLGLPKPERIPTPTPSTVGRQPNHTLSPWGNARRGRGLTSRPTAP